MYKIVQVGAAGGEAYLLITEQKAALIDSGFAFRAEKLIENIKKELGDRGLDHILLTHSHYDHASGAPYCRDHWKESKIICSEYAANVFTRPGAKKLMSELNGEAAKIAGVTYFRPSENELSADITVKDGDMIDMGELKLRVVEMPGHTKCSIGFAEDSEKLLVGCETLGVCVPPEGDVVPCFLVSYKDSIAALQRALEFAPEHLILTPFGLMGKEKAVTVLRTALKRAEELKDFIVSGHTAGKKQNAIVDELKARMYTKEYSGFQPEGAFMINTEHMVAMVIRESAAAV